MSKLILTLILYFCIVLCYSQPGPADSYLTNIYTKYYKIADREKNLYWDMKLNSYEGNAQGYVFNGGLNQKWLVMPLYPGSNEVFFINMYNGKILDCQSSGNLNCYYDPHGGLNQRFELNKLSTNYFSITPKGVSGKAIDRCNSSLSRNPFENPDKFENNLYCYNAHYGYNQQFYFQEFGSIPFSNNIDIFNSDASLDAPPMPINLNDLGDPDTKHGLALFAKTIIPFPFVNHDGYDRIYQANNSPYYILEKWKYFKQIDRKHLGYGVAQEITTIHSIGTTTTNTTQLKHTLNVIHSISGKIVAGIEDLASQEVGLNLEVNTGTELIVTDSEEIKTSDTREVKFQKSVDEALTALIYAEVWEYRLIPLNQTTPLLTWSTTPSDLSEIICTYPYTKMNLQNSLKSTTFSPYEQQTPLNDIPHMTSNNLPSGVASSSSSYSSNYYPFLALDGNNPINTDWTVWISSLAFPNNPQWICYDFQDSKTVLAYEISPQGTLPDRSPKSWEFQGWNGVSWETLDSQYNITMSSWAEKSPAVKIFNIQHPRNFNKYRLLVTSTNGSPVVSLRRLKMFTLEDYDNRFKNKSMIPIYSIDDEKLLVPKLFNIKPNPSNGCFNIELNKVNNFNMENVIDSINLNSIDFDIRNKQLNSDAFILNMEGKLIYKFKLTQDINNLNIPLKSGAYILKVNEESQILIIK